jgi:uncharacterized Zn-binding protein involved in type VI secretion
MVDRTIAAIGDLVFCPQHGMTVITTGSDFVFIQDRPAARVGDGTSCGASITTGATLAMIDDIQIAREGDRTNHGGTILRGPYPIFHDDGLPEPPLAQALAIAAATGGQSVEPCPPTDPDAGEEA